MLAVASVILPERFLASTLLEDSEIRESTLTPSFEGIAATSDLTWARPNKDRTNKSNVWDSLTADANFVVQSSDTMMDQQIEVESPIESLDTLVKTMKNALSVPLPALRILVVLKKTSTRSGSVSCSDNGVRQLELGAKVWEKEAAVVKELVPLLLDSRCWRLLQETFCSWWRMLPAAAKEHLTPLLVISLRDPSKVSSDVSKKSSEKASKVSQLVSSPQAACTLSL